MPRRTKADTFSLALGRRVRQLRAEAGLTLEKLAYESELGSKGHLSSIEHGLVRPTIHTLKVLAERLDVLPLDLVTFPEDDDRQRLIDRTRHMSAAMLRGLLRQSAHPAPALGPVRAAERRAEYGPSRPSRPRRRPR